MLRRFHFSLKSKKPLGSNEDKTRKKQKRVIFIAQKLKKYFAINNVVKISFGYRI
jgi:hypothetical protein